MKQKGTHQLPVLKVNPLAKKVRDMMLKFDARNFQSLTCKFTSIKHEPPTFLRRLSRGTRALRGH